MESVRTEQIDLRRCWRFESYCDAWISAAYSACYSLLRHIKAHFGHTKLVRAAIPDLTKFEAVFASDQDSNLGTW